RHSPARTLRIRGALVAAEPGIRGAFTRVQLCTLSRGIDVRTTAPFAVDTARPHRRARCRRRSHDEAGRDALGWYPRAACIERRPVRRRAQRQGCVWTVPWRL